MQVTEHTEQQRPVLLAAVRWTCWRCFRSIGMVRGSTVIIEHHGRRIEAQLPCSQICNHCRTLCVWDASDTRLLT